MLILRSMLYVPANRENMVARAHQTPADVIILDLEDSVPPAEKEATRAGIAASVASLKAAGKTVHVRVNHFETGLTEGDLTAVIVPGLDGIAFPKAKTGEEIGRLDEMIGRLEANASIAAGSIGLVPHVESAMGVLNCRDIASAAPRSIGLALSGFDYVADMGVDRTPAGGELEYVRRIIAHCAVAYGLQPLDTPFGDFKDEAGLVAETTYVKSIGFKGKHLIHPAQVEPVNRVFEPKAEAVEESRRIVAAFVEAEARGEASIQVDGRMVDTAIVRRARDLIAYADAISTA